MFFRLKAYYISSTSFNFHIFFSPAIILKSCFLLPNSSIKVHVIFLVIEHSCTVTYRWFSCWKYVFFYVLFFRFPSCDYFALHFHTLPLFIGVCDWVFCLRTFWIFEIPLFFCFPHSFRTIHHRTGCRTRFRWVGSLVRVFWGRIIPQNHFPRWVCWFRTGSYDLWTFK